MIRTGYPFALFLMVCLVASCTRKEIESRCFAGLTKTEVEKILGEQDDTKTLTKNTEHVWGPIEDLWDQLDVGDKIETWTYKTSTGRKELYFLEIPENVAGEFFWYDDHKKNPVFEGKDPTSGSSVPRAAGASAATEP